jgi:hypothetical protein
VVLDSKKRYKPIFGWFGGSSSSSHDFLLVVDMEIHTHSDSWGEQENDLLKKESIVDGCRNLLVYSSHRVMYVCLRGIGMNQT